MIELELPWPPKELSPNARVHWAKKSTIVKKYKSWCFYIAKAHKPQFKKDEKIQISIQFFPPDARRRDDDNLLSSFKSGRDGIAQAWGIDDCRFKTTFEVCDPAKNGKVIFRIETPD